MSHDALTDDLWRCIGLKLDAADRIRFRAVSKSWMSLVPPPLWLMLAEQEESPMDSNGDNRGGEDEREPEHGDDDRGEQHQQQDQVGDEQEKASSVSAPPPPPLRGFATIGKEQQIVYIDYPPLRGAHSLGSTGNWLITAHIDKSIRIINPFAKMQFHLPPISEFENPVLHRRHTQSDVIPLDRFINKHLWKLVLSSPPSPSKGCGSVVAVAIHNVQGIMAIARVGDAKWTTLKIGEELYRRAVKVQDVIFYKKKFYACTGFGLFVCDIEDDGPPRSTYVSSFPQTYSHWYVNYLVEWLGELLWVNKRVENMTSCGGDYRTSRFEVHRYDFVEEKWDEVKSLGDHSLFLGFNTSVALKASDYGGLFRKNCIYFTDDFELGYCGIKPSRIPGGKDMGVYDLSDKSITPHFRGVSTSLYSPPLWIISTS